MSRRWLAARARRLSLRTRLVAGVLALAAVGLLATDLATLFLLSSYLDTRTDAQLLAIQYRLRQDDERQLPLRLPPPPARAALTALVGDFVVESRGADGVLIARFPDEAHPPLGLPPVDELRDQDRLDHPFTFAASRPGGDDERSFRVLIWANSRSAGTTMVALDMSGPIATRQRLLVIEGVVTLAVLALIGILGVAVVRVGLRPLEDVETTAESIVAGGDLSRRVSTQAEPNTEIGRLAVTLNGMLENLQRAFAQRAESEDRLRRFVADASHELRTPTAGIRGFAELYRHGAVHQPEQIGDLFARIEAEATRMGLLVEDLLMLARLDQQRPRESEPVDLLPLAVDAVEAARVIAPDRPLRLEIVPEQDEPGAPTPVVLGDELALRQVTTNLVGNALQHTPPDALVTVRVGVPTGQRYALFEVVDRGAGLDPADADRVFERFFRADPARTRKPDQPVGPGHRVGYGQTGGAGVGLGLSIVAGVVAAHDGTVRHRRTPGGGATFRVELPLAPGSSPAI